MKKAKDAKVTMTTEEALAAAEAEGLILVHSNKGAGFKGVALNPSPKNPFKAEQRSLPARTASVGDPLLSTCHRLLRRRS